MMLKILDHPLIKHKISLLRDETTGAKEFRELVREVTTLMTYEVTRDLPLKTVFIKTPVGIAESGIVGGRKIAFVPIMRAGLGMLDGALSLLPAAKVGHIGVYRDSGDVGEYYSKLPTDIAERDVILIDVMIAKGYCATRAIDIIKKSRELSKVKSTVRTSIKLMCILIGEGGYENIQKAHPDVEIFTGAVDKEIDECGFLLPGMGDAGDRLFGTK